MTVNPTKPPPDIARAENAIAKVALAYPEVHEDAPWGHRAFKVKKKTFLFLTADGEGLGLSVKLPMSSDLALALPFAEPTGYGLGKSGWVSAGFSPGETIPLDILTAWVDESYRAIAPKKVVAAMDGPKTEVPAKKKASAKKKAPKAKTRPKK